MNCNVLIKIGILYLKYESGFRERIIKHEYVIINARIAVVRLSNRMFIDIKLSGH